MKQKGLGRGLGALLSETEVSPEALDAATSGANPATLEVDVARIDVCASQPRKTFDDEKLAELAESIRAHGVIQPLILSPKEDRYMIVAGERRFRAARMAGIKRVPAVIKDVDSRDILEISIIENIQREDLNPIEEAAAIEMLMREHGLTQEAVSQRLGKSRSAIANSLRLLSLPEGVRGYVSSGKLSAGHARALLSLKAPAAIAEAAERVVAGGLSVRDAEKLAKKLSAPPREQKPPSQSPEILDAQVQLSEQLGTKVIISGNGERGRLIIEYYSADQLAELYDGFISWQH